MNWLMILGFVIWSDGGDQGKNRLWRMREEGKKGSGGNEGCEASGHTAQSPQANSRRIRWTSEGSVTCPTSNGQEGRALAIRAVRRSCPPLRRWGLWQKSPCRVRAKPRPASLAAGTCEFPWGAVHHSI